MSTILDYDIIVVTANRTDILRTSLPSMLQQSRLPKSLIVADASDDHQQVVRTVQEVTQGVPFPVNIYQAPRKGLTRQRNFAFQHTSSPIVFFPDDDSVWYGDVAERVMRIYERDTKQQIGGVGQVETFESPFHITAEQKQARQTSLLKNLKYRLSLLRHAVLNRLVENPLHRCGHDLLSRHEIPTWLNEVDAVPADRLIGFRMTFRADAIRRHCFDEDLHQPRCLWEDFAISYSVLQDQILVEAQNAKVFHHRFEGARSNGLTTGIEQFLNICYLVCKYSPPHSAARKSLYSYTRIFLAEAALLRAPTAPFERDKLRGFLRARREFQFLIDSPLDELTQRYKQAIGRCLNENMSDH